MDGPNFDGSILCDPAGTLHSALTTMTLDRQIAHAFPPSPHFARIVLECSRIHLPQDRDGSFFILKRREIAHYPYAWRGLDEHGLEEHAANAQEEYSTDG